jgi:SAM-dependent methyltransferase
MDSLDQINAETRETVNRAARTYHDLFHDELEGKPYDRQLLDRFAARFSKTSLILDAGCGPSFHIGRYLLNRGVEVEGVDISDECVTLAQELNPGARIRCGELGNLDCPDESYDGILAYYSIIHTPKRFVGRLFDEFHRLLRPGGLLLTAVKTGETDGWMEDVLGTGARIWFTYFTMEEITDYHQQAGFGIEFMEQRKPYDTEIENERIYTVGVKEDRPGPVDEEDGRPRSEGQCPACSPGSANHLDGDGGREP